MSSVFNTDKHIDIKYDLKGSLSGRRTSPAACKLGAVQKDLNLLESGKLCDNNVIKSVKHTCIVFVIACCSELCKMTYFITQIYSYSTYLHHTHGLYLCVIDV